MLLPFYSKDSLEAGCDEAGRGCLAGPVYAAAVILPTDFACEELNDSKQLTEKQRYALRPIIEKAAIAWSVGIVSAPEIDQINILNASFLAMHRAIRQLQTKPETLLIDGNRFRYVRQLPLYRLPDKDGEPLFDGYPELPYTCIVKGDGKYMSIAAASILAKTYRDDRMLELNHQCPAYHWDNNKGYPTEEHRQAIRTDGLSEYHRRSFHLESDQLTLDF
ncbi:MAG: ribonuclease HII [Bacteroidota bacterium]|nr:ribonuclease HII [Bacteroidota bacterium]